MADPFELESFAVKSYRYLRLSIVVVVAALFASVLYERSRVDCWQESVSAYWYTPVQAVFVGALLAVGVSLVVIRGSTDWEDVLLNVAGLLAPVVAFVPTEAPARRCASVAFDVDDPRAAEAFIENNVIGFAVGGAVALVVAAALARRRGRGTGRPRFEPSTATGLVLAAGLLVGGLVWYGAFRDSFLARAHGAAAVAMFVFVFVVMVINAFAADPAYRRIYAATATAMALGAVGTVAAQAVVGTWRHQILWLEVLELVPFGVFWAVQTVEHWDGGVPTGRERDARTACIPALPGADRR